MRLLVTNDDGIASPGLHALARTLAEADHDVTFTYRRSTRSEPRGPRDYRDRSCGPQEPA